MAAPVVEVREDGPVCIITLNRPELSAALADEGRGGYPVVFSEALEGAARFAAGVGRHGSFERGG